MKEVIYAFILSLIGIAVNAQESEVPKKIYQTRPIEEDAIPTIDGILNDSIWSVGQWESDFIQRNPNEGVDPSEGTKFKILYDSKFLYVAIQCLDSRPNEIGNLMSRRDGFEGDWVTVMIDSYHDLQTAYSFLTTAAGVKGDEFLSENGNDANWNPIWYTKTSITSEGWTAEMKIPFSQLRFSDAKEQVWGLQIMRKLFRAEERSTWQRIPLDAGAWVANFGELHGIKDLKSRRQVELQPYVVGQSDFYKQEVGNPFRTGNDQILKAGLDGKIGLNNALTLDFTINPDFGQVEADPANLALDGFQIFFNEQRPFFIENSNIFRYAVSPSEAGNTFGNDNLFYSRRIGKEPSRYVSLEDNEFVDRPNQTKILGAVKVSGKTKNGWSIGLMESVTSKEFATIDSLGDQSQELIEPLTSYFVGRIKKDFNNRNTTIGGILSSTNRKLIPELDFLHKDAYSGGFDVKHYWKDRAWYAEASTVFSKVKGSTYAITRTQNQLSHLYQRVDADHLQVDTSATALSGNGGVIKIGKVGAGDFIFESGFAWRTPGLELNDIGFQRKGDDLRHFNWMGYRWRKPFSIFQQVSVNYNHWVGFDYEGNHNELAFNVNTNATFKNFYSGGFGANVNPIRYSNTELRGGPRMRFVPSASGWIWGQSDQRKRFMLGFHSSFGGSQNKASRFSNYEVWSTYRPSKVFNIRLSTFLNTTNYKLQYVNEVSTTEETKYIGGTIDRKTLGLSLRLNYTINPNLSVQYYGQPYMSRARYSDFKTFQNHNSPNLVEKANLIRSEHISYNEDHSQYIVDDGISSYEFSNPDFMFVQFRSNFVVRWEYVPGSELFFVWSQGSTGFGDPKTDLYQGFDNEILNGNIDNTFLIKATYRFIL